MILVLSPAKSLDFATPPTVKDYTQPDFLDQSQVLVERLRQLSPLDLSQLMGISDSLAVLNAARYASWGRPFTPDNAKQAVLA
ncbi:MAG: peroxide stress protein YaaA, partial [Propionivibrio sp.]|nr:peroxide stress protein YaaA [Propionivibrio sp.]